MTHMQHIFSGMQVEKHITTKHIPLSPVISHTSHMHQHTPQTFFLPQKALQSRGVGSMVGLLHHVTVPTAYLSNQNWTCSPLNSKNFTSTAAMRHPRAQTAQKVLKIYKYNTPCPFCHLLAQLSFCIVFVLQVCISRVHDMFLKLFCIHNIILHHIHICFNKHSNIYTV